MSKVYKYKKFGWLGADSANQVSYETLVYAFSQHLYSEKNLGNNIYACQSYLIILLDAISFSFFSWHVWHSF